MPFPPTAVRVELPANVDKGSSECFELPTKVGTDRVADCVEDSEHSHCLTIAGSFANWL